MPALLCAIAAVPASPNPIHGKPEVWVMGGTPVFAGTRVPVQTLFEYLEAGEHPYRLISFTSPAKRWARSSYWPEPVHSKERPMPLLEMFNEWALRSPNVVEASIRE